MKTSQEIDKITPALIAAQTNLEPVIKDTDNAFLKTKYATLVSVHKAVIPAFRAQDLIFVQGGDSLADNSLGLTTRLLHKSGQWMEMTCPLPLSKQGGQELGSMITYGRKYAVLAFAGAAPEDDDGNAASEIADSKRRDKDSLTALTPTQSKEIENLRDILDADENKMKATALRHSNNRTDSVEALMKTEAVTLIAAMRKAAEGKSI